jgi:hypothetical protein
VGRTSNGKDRSRSLRDDNKNTTAEARGILKQAKTRAKTKYRDPSPFDFAQGQDDDIVGSFQDDDVIRMAT